METHFIPSRRRGYIFQGVILFILAGGGGLAFWSSLQQGAGSDLAFYMVLSVLLLAPTPLIVYRIYALSQATYTLERDGLRIRWGLRGEDIPLPQIEWVRPVNELGFPVRMPWASSPGAYLGATNVEGLGQVEFIASDVHNMLLVATPQKVYVISPDDAKLFIRSFRRMIELGSLSPLATYSVRPVAFLETVWSDLPVRGMILAGLGLTLALFLVVGLRIPSLQVVSLGFDAARQPLNPGPPESLLLLAVLGGFSYVIDLIGGLFYYHHLERRPLAYLLLGACVAAPLLLLVGALVSR